MNQFSLPSEKLSIEISMVEIKQVVLKDFDFECRCKPIVFRHLRENIEREQLALVLSESGYLFEKK